MKLEVLIAEDDDLVRFTVREALEAAGHAVEAVADGQDAITRLTEKAFDVVISDVWMSKVNGVALFHHVRKFAHGTGFILITAHGSVSDAVESLKAGVDDYVTKPFDIAELVIRVERLGERMRLHHELREARARASARSSRVDACTWRDVFAADADRMARPGVGRPTT